MLDARPLSGETPAPVRPRHRLLRWLAVGLAAILLIPPIGLTAAAWVYVLVVPPVRASVPALSGHSHRVRTGDVITRYQTWGRRGIPVVLVPGFVESSFVWQRVGPMLGRSYRVYAPDIRGFGYTTHRGPYTLAADTAQMVNFLRALHLTSHRTSPVLVGHSSGAAIVADLALRHPHLVSGLVMLDGDGTSSGAGPGWVHSLLVDPIFSAAMRFTLRHPSIVRAVWDRVCGPDCPPFSGSELSGWERPLEVPGAAASLHAIVQAPLIGLPPRDLERVHVRSAVMLGAGDPTITTAGARAVAHWLHTRLIVTIPGARHLPMISQPAVFTHDLSEVVRRLEIR